MRRCLSARRGRRCPKNLRLLLEEHFMQHGIIKRALALSVAMGVGFWPLTPAMAHDDGDEHFRHLTHVASANTKTVGVPAPNVLSPELIETIVAQGATPLENPSALTSFYGYDN